MRRQEEVIPAKTAGPGSIHVLTASSTDLGNITIVMNRKLSTSGIKGEPIFVTILYSEILSLANLLQLKMAGRVPGMHLTNYSGILNPHIMKLRAVGILDIMVMFVSEPRCR